MLAGLVGVAARLVAPYSAVKEHDNMKNSEYNLALCAFIRNFAH